MISVKGKVLQYCQNLDLGDDWVWMKSKGLYRYKPFTGVEIQINPLWSFNSGSGKTRVGVAILIKEFSDIHKLIGLLGPDRAWYSTLCNYTKWFPYNRKQLPFNFMIWSDKEISSTRDSWFHIDEIHVVMELIVNSSLELIKKEFNFSNREFFIKSLMLENDDPRLDNQQTMFDIGIVRQCILRIMHGDFEFVENAMEKFSNYGGDHREDIPLILEKMDDIKELLQRQVS